MSLGEILTQATIDEEGLSEATNCDPMPASSNESEKPSCSSSNTAFRKSPQTSKGPSQSSCGKERETIMLNNTFPDVDVHQQNLCGIKHTCELVYSVKPQLKRFQNSSILCLVDQKHMILKRGYGGLFFKQMRVCFAFFVKNMTLTMPKTKRNTLAKSQQ